jgi:hypothetical protein
MMKQLLGCQDLMLMLNRSSSYWISSGSLSAGRLRDYGPGTELALLFKLRAKIFEWAAVRKIGDFLSKHCKFAPTRTSAFVERRSTVLQKERKMNKAPRPHYRMVGQINHRRIQFFRARTDVNLSAIALHTQ